jgi:nicotinamidase-related amidase
MSTLADRPNTALLVIDVQNGVMSSAHDREAVVANIAALVARARAAHTPVIWVQHESAELVKDTEAWRFVPELDPRRTEPLIAKRYGDAFEETALEDTLAELGVGRLVVSGAQTDACIRSTLHGAFTRGYDVTLAADAHTTEDLSQWGAPPPGQVIAHTNLYWTYQRAPGREAAVAKAAEAPLANA